MEWFYTNFVEPFINWILSLPDAAREFILSLINSLPRKTNIVSATYALIEQSGIFQWLVYLLGLLDMLVPIQLLIGLAFIPYLARFVLLIARSVRWAWESLPFN